MSENSSKYLEASAELLSILIKYTIENTEVVCTSINDDDRIITMFQQLFLEQNCCSWSEFFSALMIEKLI